MRLRVKEEGRRAVNLHIPLFLVWILVVALLLLVLPLVIIATILLWHRGIGMTIFTFYVGIFRILFTMSGFKMDISRPGKEVVVSMI
jgi:hypothetical protein